ncbi:DUF422 domain-containing protein [Citroniella saccharovorans]|uniref:DUF422 domain-containing protein n=1 Tax=Citroniella saccharovorans TaxID=2053367 RepID=A0AAW9N140_9FIRM|nr:DUF422 domain-containing protein [Citroniella saccharovorans]MEB3430002.1 DUF422 domain-containing protein [Citroniella saccharovorans]
MNWINSFEIICYFLVLILIIDIVKGKSYRELGLLISGALAGFCLELLAVRFTDIYHYSKDFYISIGKSNYQFPFFGGLMWGGVSVCALRIANKFSTDKFTKALLSGFLIVSMDLFLDVVAIRLDGGFWVWDGRPINLIINHHMFMSVIWVNFFGYMFEVPAIIYMTLSHWEKSNSKDSINLLKSILIAFAGVVFVALSSTVALFLNRLSDEWFSFLAFILIWIFVFVRLIIIIIRHRKDISFSGKKDYALIIFWLSIYTYCICALIKLKIFKEVFLYGIFAILLMLITLSLSFMNVGDEKTLK